MRSPSGPPPPTSRLVAGIESSNAGGTQATNPVSRARGRFRRRHAGSGATVGWTTTNGATLSVCSGIFLLFGDQRRKRNGFHLGHACGHRKYGDHRRLLPPEFTTLRSRSLPTMTATSTSSDIGVTTPYLWIAQGASVSVPLTARVVSLACHKSGATVDFFIAQGSGSLSAASAVTNSNGYATVTLTLTNFTANVQLSACVAPETVLARTIYGNAVAAAHD